MEESLRDSLIRIKDGVIIGICGLVLTLLLWAYLALPPE